MLRQQRRCLEHIRTRLAGAMVCFFCCRHKLNSPRFAIQMCRRAYTQMIDASHRQTDVRCPMSDVWPKFRYHNGNIIDIFCMRFCTDRPPARPRRANEQIIRSVQAAPQQKPNNSGLRLAELNWILNRLRELCIYGHCLRRASASKISPILALLALVILLVCTMGRMRDVTVCVCVCNWNNACAHISRLSESHENPHCSNNDSELCMSCTAIYNDFVCVCKLQRLDLSN